MTAMLGGHIDCVFTMPQTILSQVKTGSVRALAICTSQRHPEFPEVPTLIESGIKADPQAGINWLGFFAPKGTPKIVYDKLIEVIRQVMSDQETSNALRKIGSLPEFRDQREFKTLIEKQSAIYKELIGKLGLKKN